MIGLMASLRDLVIEQVLSCELAACLPSMFDSDTCMRLATRKACLKKYRGGLLEMKCLHKYAIWECKTEGAHCSDFNSDYIDQFSLVLSLSKVWFLSSVDDAIISL